MIARDLAAAQATGQDLVVVGGGVQGCILALEASRRGLRVAVLERGDFGGGTSWNSLRILHGGLRYLQTLDLVRFRESVRERRWFFRSFPELVRPLPCVMPLSGAGLRRPSVLRGVLTVNDLLSAGRNRGVPPEGRLPSSGVLNADEVIARVPEACGPSVRGGALWYDGLMPSPQRVLMQILKRACRRECTALNHVEVGHLLRANGRVAGVRALDLESGTELEIEASVVVNAAGPDGGLLARRLDAEASRLFRPSLAFNLLLEGSLTSDGAVAVYPDEPNPHTYFLYPFHGRILAGTFHEPVVDDGPPEAPSPGEATLRRAIDRLNAALPGLDVARSDVVHVLPGYIPVRERGTVLDRRRAVIVEHGSRGGPAGFWSLSGVKFTTARAVARKVLDRIRREGLVEVQAAAPQEPSGTPPPWEPPTPDPDELLKAPDPEGREVLHRIVREEAVLHLDDLLLRRLDGLRVIDRTQEVGRALCRRLGWSRERTGTELDRLRRSVSEPRTGGSPTARVPPTEHGARRGRGT